MLVDSDVIIWYLRGFPPARPYVEDKNFSCSTISYMEVLRGAKNKKELKQIISFFKQSTILPITPAISQKAQYYVEQFSLSHSIELQDALIAATAIENSIELVTANMKHYKPIPNLKLKQF